MAHVFVVTHGDKGNEPNPSMTEKGFAQIRSLAQHLPDSPSDIVCGTGRRHQNMATALGWTPNRWTEVVGGATSLVKVDGQEMIVLADGTRVPRKAYTTTTDLAGAMRDLITALPDGAVILAGRLAMIQLGMKDAKNGAVYQITVFEAPLFPDRSIHEIKEIAVAGGDVGAGAKEA